MNTLLKDLSLLMWLKRILLSSLGIGLIGCATIPTGTAKIELIDQLVVQQEFKKIKRLLENIDTKDSEFESLVIRRRAIRPLIVQFERFSVDRADTLKARDLWPQALLVLREAQKKLPYSQVLEAAEKNFFSQRADRLAYMQQQITLLEGQNQQDKSVWVDKSVDIHPKGIKTRWQAFQHQRKSEALASEMLDCGDRALAEQQLELADTCFSMVKALSVGFDVTERLASIEAQRQFIQRQTEQVANAKVLEREQREQKQVLELKEQYRHLAAAGWLVAAKQSLVQLRLLIPDDEQTKQWAVVLQQTIDQEVKLGISRGQALYSHGNLQDALITWQNTTYLDPENPILQAHIARAERFLEKFERLNGGKS